MWVRPTHRSVCVRVNGAVRRVALDPAVARWDLNRARWRRRERVDLGSEGAALWITHRIPLERYYALHHQLLGLLRRPGVSMLSSSTTAGVLALARHLTRRPRLRFACHSPREAGHSLIECARRPASPAANCVRSAHSPQRHDIAPPQMPQAYAQAVKQ
jgi:hypothetical protein